MKLVQFIKMDFDRQKLYTVTAAKEKLDLIALNYRNVNPIGNKLYIRVNLQVYEQFHEQLSFVLVE